MSDCCPSHVIVRHQGPPGPGLPPGGTTGQIPIKQSDDDYDVVWSNSGSGAGDVVGPPSSVNNRLAAFDGTTGSLIKDSGILISDVFTTTAANGKVDKLPGKGLSTNDFTDTYRAKLDSASGGNYRGTYASYVALTTALPSGNAGDYAYVVTLGNDPILVIWDVVNNNWHPYDAFELDGQDVANVIYNPSDSVTWSQADNRRYTQADKNAVDGAASLAYVNSLALAAGILAPAFGAINYFNTTGVSLNITGVSDGTSNMIAVPSVTTLDPSSTLFDSPSPGRLRFTGTSSRLFIVTFNLSFSGPASSDLVIAVAKNGSPLAVAKVIQGMDASGTTQAISSTDFVSLTTNDYLEVYIGNLTNTNDPTIKKLAIVASPA